MVSGFGVFVSYARRDDEQGVVSALVDSIRAELSRVVGDNGWEVFFDQHDIQTLSDWRSQIQGALRESSVLIACVSKNYFASTPCWWEWQEHAQRVVERRHILIQKHFQDLYNSGNNTDIAEQT